MRRSLLEVATGIALMPVAFTLVHLLNGWLCKAIGISQ